MNASAPFISDLYAKLLVCEFRSRFAPLTGEKVNPLTGDEVHTLIAAASALSLTRGEEEQAARDRNLAYDIVTRLVPLNGHLPGVVPAADHILSRLGNFPGRDLLTKEYNQTQAQLPSWLLKLESRTRLEENTITLAGEHQFTLTDFQHRLLSALQQPQPLSISAPTSAGKSFALSLDVGRRMAATPGVTLVYLVPTRALIRQVMRDVGHVLDRLGLGAVTVLSAPVPVEPQTSAAGVVYVLTQERLMTLLFADPTLVIDTLYIDEAQELEDLERGMILHSAIDLTLRRYPGVKIIFSSPLTANPQFLLSEFRLQTTGRRIRELESPVSQTLLFLSEVAGEDYQIDVQVLCCNRLKRVTRVATEFKYRGVIDRFARTAMLFTQSGETSIVYANRASDAENLAETIADFLPIPASIDPEVTNLIEFIKLHVSDSYSLVDLLPKGIAFHYGQMPGLVRIGVEDLLKARKLRFVCCTSTLLQGVNLPAKNIFIQAPRRGNGKPMTSAAFWNLAGRAGRLRESFSGNVWCLSIDDWKHNPLKGERLSEITSAFRNTLDSKRAAESILGLIKDRTLPSDGSSEEQAFAKIFAEFALGPERLADSQYATTENHAQLTAIDEACELMRKQIHVPQEILEKNASISPWRLECLYRKFANAKNIEKCLPVDPRKGVAPLRRIFYALELVFFRTGNKSYRYFAGLAYFWIKGDTLALLIKNRIDYQKLTERKAINNEIRKLLNDLESVLHFKYVKFTRAYIDVLEWYLVNSGQQKLAERIAPLHIYIEFGASDPVLISLMSLGLSRTTAIILHRSIGRGWNVVTSRSDLVRRLRGINFKTAKIPRVCEWEIQDFIG